MKQITKTIFISVLFFSIILTIKAQYFQGQNKYTKQMQNQDNNLIILHKRNTPLYNKSDLFDDKNAKEYKIRNNDIIRVNSKVNIITKNGFKYKGNIIEIKDSSLVISGKINEVKRSSHKSEKGYDDKGNHFVIVNNKVSLEIPMNEIKYIYHHRSSPLKSSDGKMLLIGEAGGGVGLISSLKNDQSNGFPQGNYNTDNSEAILYAAIGTVIVISLTDYFFFDHRKKYDMENKYDLIIMKDNKTLYYSGRYFYFK